MIGYMGPLLKKFTIFAKDRLNFQRPPRLFLRKDINNSHSILGKTAHYDPSKSCITVYVSGRHPKDIMRSFAHELVHHCQNERGDLAPEKMKTMNKNYAQENEHLRKMEEEAYLQGNMCFRDWEDSLDNKLKYRMKLAEQKFLKENKKMSVKQKLTKEFLKETIKKILEEKLSDNEDLNEEDLEEGGRALRTGNEDRFAGNEDRLAVDRVHEEEKQKEDDEDKVNENESSDEEEREEKNENLKTPEGQHELYEKRFSNRNSRLYEKLLKEWTK